MKASEMKSGKTSGYMMHRQGDFLNLSAPIP